MRQKHTGADGEVKFVAHRNLFVGFMGGRVVVTKRTDTACYEFLAKLGVKPVAKSMSKPVTKPVVKPVRNISPEIKAGAAAFIAYREKQAQQESEPVLEAEVPDLLDEPEDRWSRCEQFDREYFSIQMADID